MKHPIGSFVRLVVPGPFKAEAFARGRVDAIECYEDWHGERTWIYVRWFDADGVPDANSKKHAEQEIEQA